ncbi:MAG: hypothetical protein ACNYPI_01295 [Arenicellales bacterium WSBS_2016_MAG_OTU3]
MLWLAGGSVNECRRQVASPVGKCKCLGVGLLALSVKLPIGAVIMISIGSAIMRDGKQYQAGNHPYQEQT